MPRPALFLFVFDIFWYFCFGFNHKASLGEIVLDICQNLQQYEKSTKLQSGHWINYIDAVQPFFLPFTAIITAKYYYKRIFWESSMKYKYTNQHKRRIPNRCQELINSIQKMNWLSQYSLKFIKRNMKIKYLYLATWVHDVRGSLAQSQRQSVTWPSFFHKWIFNDIILENLKRPTYPVMAFGLLLSWN